jgi:hypothetical protein
MDGYLNGMMKRDFGSGEFGEIWRNREIKRMHRNKL